MLDIFNKWRGAVDRCLQQVPVALCKESPELQEAAHYVLEGAGKKLRALLILSLQNDLHSDEKLPVVLGFQAATGIELLHAASLIHDDLPAIDNDDYRRGRPSCHKAFGEATAILLGDFLIGAAFTSVTEPEQSDRRSALMARLLGVTWCKLCEGQQRDLKPQELSEYHRRTKELKTGELFGCSAAFGAVLADCDDATIKQCREWGLSLGVVFQKLDDLLDGDANAEPMENIQADFERLGGELRQISSNSEFAHTRALLEVIRNVPS